MHTRYSLRFKVAFFFSALTILLLVAQALGVKAIAEAQEEKLIAALIADDMTNLIQTYRLDPALVPPLNPQLGGHVSKESLAQFTLPMWVKDLRDGTHEIIVGDREIHIAIAPFDDARVYRIYDFSAYEQRFKNVIGALMVGTGMFALLTIWLAFGLSGLLVRQIAGFARQVKALRLGASVTLNPGKYDEVEVVELIEAFNDYHRRMAQMVEREKEFTSNVSHELRTPLTAIKTSCELLDQDGAIGLRSKARLRQVDRATDKMIELVNALLLLAREESSAEVGPTGLVNAINEALDSFIDVLVAKGIETAIDIDRLLRVNVNPSALAIVLSNLIDNAVTHTDGGSLSFTLADGWLQVKDTGHGIPKQALPHVFERFYQVKSEQATGRGFGIGLSIVKKICDHYEWSIKFESETDKGTCVSLRLPQAD